MLPCDHSLRENLASTNLTHYFDGFCPDKTRFRTGTPGFKLIAVVLAQ